MGKKIKFMRISKNQDMTDVQTKVLGKLTKDLGTRDYLPDFECTFDREKTYQYVWKENFGKGYLVAFVEADEIKEFLKKNKKYANEIGFDPLSPGYMEVFVEVYVYSPDKFPEEGLKSLFLAKDRVEGNEKSHIVLVTTDKIIRKFCS